MERVDVLNLASLAQIHLSDDEAEAIGREMTPLFDMADLLPDIGAETDGTSPGDTGECVNVADLREDTPIRMVDPEEFIEQSPSAGDGGFTIKRLLE